MTIYPPRIAYNAKVIADLCKPSGIRLWGVTKVMEGDPIIGRAMINGGCFGLADSRLENLMRLHDKFPKVPLMLIRPPSHSRIAEMVATCTHSLQSEIETIKLIGEVAVKKSKRHKVTVMVELGDLREGIMSDNLLPVVFETLRTPGVELEGIGGVLTCFAGITPTTENLGKLIEMARLVESEFQVKLNTVSGGATNTIPMLLDGTLPQGINEFRVGEGIMLGMDVLTRKPLPGLEYNTVEVTAEVIEVRSKPTSPQGRVTQDAFGHRPSFEDRGERRRAIVNLGRADVEPELLTPLMDGIQVLGGSSDHIVLDVEDAKEEIVLGSQIKFLPGYGALLRLIGSPYVGKIYKEETWHTRNQAAPATMAGTATRNTGA